MDRCSAGRNNKGRAPNMYDTKNPGDLVPPNLSVTYPSKVHPTIMATSKRTVRLSAAAWLDKVRVR